MRTPVVRGLAMVLIMAYMALSPAVRQVAGVKTDVFRYWMMYSGVGFDVCRASFAERGADGTLAPLDRREIIAGSERIWKLSTPEAARTYASRLCRAAPGRDLRAAVDCPARGVGWKPVITFEEPLCSR